MKIVVAQDALHSEGGVETYLASVVPALRARGHSIALLFVSRGATPPFDGVDGPRLAVDPAHVEEAFTRLRAWEPDVCFSNNMAQLDIEQRLLSEWPVVKFMHGYSGTCISALKTHAFPARVACARTLGPACLALYGPRHCGALSASALIGGYRWAREQQRVLGRYATVVVASDHMAGEYARHGVPRDRIATLPLFTAPPGQSPAVRGDANRVLFLGRMTHLKGGDLLVRAVAAAARRLDRSIALEMAGDGPQRLTWERLASNERVDAKFPGWLDPTERQAALSRATVLAVPSVWPEPFGLVGLEAAAMGVPAVAFDTGGIRQWLRHGVSGLLVPPSSGPAGLADALVEIFRHPDRRAQLSAGALAAARDMSVEAHLAALEQVLHRAARGSARVKVAASR